MSKGKRRQEGKKVHRDIYAGGHIGKKQEKKKSGNYTPSGPARAGKTAQEEYSTSTPQATTSRSSAFLDSRTSRSGLEGLSFSGKRLQLPPGVKEFGCWWKMGDYQFRMIQGDNINTGFRPTEVPIMYNRISKDPLSRGFDTSHVYVELPENSTYVSVNGKVVEIPYLKRKVAGQDKCLYARTTDSSEILFFNPE